MELDWSLFPPVSSANIQLPTGQEGSEELAPLVFSPDGDRTAWLDELLADLE